MLNLTLEAYGEKIPIRVRTGWHEVSTAHYAKVFNLEGDALLAGILEVDPDLIEEFPHETKLHLAELLSWAATETPTQAKPQKMPQNIGTCTIGQVEMSFDALKRHGFEGAAHVVYAMFMYPFKQRFLNPNYKWNLPACTSYAEKVKTMPISEVYPVAVHLTNLIGEFKKKYEHLLKTEPDEMEEQAGVQRFAKYGFFATLWHRCGGDPTRFDDMIQVPASEFMATIAMGTEVEEYQQQLQELKQRINQFE